MTGWSSNHSAFIKKPFYLKVRCSINKGMRSTRRQLNCSQLELENCYLIIGRLSLAKEPKGSVLIVAVTDKFKQREVAASATMVLKYAPAVLPAWRDVATESPFLVWLYQGNARREIPFYLFFGYKTGESSDGTVTLQSQLEGRVHLSALKSYGFNATHEGILNDDQVRQTFHKVLQAMDKKGN